MENTDEEPVPSNSVSAGESEEQGSNPTSAEQPANEEVSASPSSNVAWERGRSIYGDSANMILGTLADDLSTTTDSDGDNFSENATLRSSLFSTIQGIISNTSVVNLSSVSDDESTCESTEISPKCEEFCNPKIPPNWFAIKEIYKRQIGYTSRLNGHVQFQNRYYGSLHVAQRLELMSMMEYHNSCVNALGFNPEGNLLASASDDLRVVIWDWAYARRKISWVTRHRANIFQCKFLPLSGKSELQLVTSDRYGHVWLWQLGEVGLRGSRKFANHDGAAHKLTLVTDQPHVILSCGEDALVYSHDVREPKSHKLVHVRNKDNNEVPLFSIHNHPLVSPEFCVSGHDQAVAVYDSRFISKGAPMKRYEVTGKDMSGDRITASMYNYCGNELLVSYNEGNIYLFDTTEPEGSDFIHCYQGHRNEATIKGVNFFGPKSEYIISGSDCGHIFFWDKQTQGIVQFLRADKGVVNVLETHPSIPILGSSGLDPDVKIWVPSREQPHEMEDLVQTASSNMRSRNLNSNGRGDTQFFYMLWRGLQGSVNRVTALHRNRFARPDDIDVNVSDDEEEEEELAVSLSDDEEDEVDTAADVLLEGMDSEEDSHDDDHPNVECRQS